MIKKTLIFSLFLVKLFKPFEMRLKNKKISSDLANDLRTVRVETRSRRMITDLKIWREHSPWATFGDNLVVSGNESGWRLWKIGFYFVCHAVDYQTRIVFEFAKFARTSSWSHMHSSGKIYRRLQLPSLQGSLPLKLE